MWALTMKIHHFPSVWWKYAQVIKSVVLYEHFSCLAINAFLDKKSSFVQLPRPENEKGEADFMHF